MSFRTRTNPNQKKKQGGFTALELGIVLLVSAVVIAFAATAGSKLWSDHQTTTEAQNIAALYSTTKSIKDLDGYGAANSDLVLTLHNLNALPKSMSYAGEELTNAWGGAVAITSTGMGYSISYSGVPRSACVELAQKISRGGASRTKPGTGTEVVGVVSRATAISGCQTDSNQLVFTSQS